MCGVVHWSLWARALFETQVKCLVHSPLSNQKAQMSREHRVLGIIPARYASTRLPGKPLALIAGKPMIQVAIAFHSSSSQVTVYIRGLMKVQSKQSL
jgi:hypothetical protein